ncbi:MAG TPA: hypothetical protein DEB24_03920 [Coriobacteriia bacterium]|nr:hypothetical protein [Coriobacteriia bacterium]
MKKFLARKNPQIVSKYRIRIENHKQQEVLKEYDVFGSRSDYDTCETDDLLLRCPSTGKNISRGTGTESASPLT